VISVLESGVLFFRSLIRLITLVKIAQSTKKDTTPTTQTTNNSVTIFFYDKSYQPSTFSYQPSLGLLKADG
jgi:hypothetical protein